MELVEITMDQVADAVHKINNRPRKCLVFKTPYEAFEEFTGINVGNLMGYALFA